VIRNVLVLGGTGFVGRSICERLVERNGGGGGRITVPSRRPQRATHLRTLPTVEVVAGHLHDEPSLGRLIQGQDAIINLVAILHGSEAEFRRAHVELPQRLARLAAAFGVQRVVHVSALGVNVQNPPDATSRYLRSKSEGELALRRGVASCTVLRPSVIFGEHDRFMNLFATLQGLAPVVPLAGASAQLQPVWVEDVARAAVQSLDDERAFGQTIECAGPKVYTLADLVRLAGQWSGHPRPVVPLPAPLGQLQALVMEFAPGPTLMSRDNLDSMKTPNVASGRLPGLELLDIVPTPLESIAAPLLGGLRGAGRFNLWRAGVPRRRA
jgi:NADH dehydrogenase